MLPCSGASSPCFAMFFDFTLHDISFMRRFIRPSRHTNSTPFHDRTLLHFSQPQGRRRRATDPWTLRDAQKSILVTGEPGSGKTSTVGHTLASSLLHAQHLPAEARAAMIIFLYKKEDAEFWLRLAAQCGREDDLIVLGSDDRDVLNILDHYREQETLNAVSALNTISELTQQQQGMPGEAYWETEKQKRLHRALHLLKLANEPLTIPNLYRVHMSAPHDYEQKTSEAFQRDSYCWQLLARAANQIGEDHDDFRMVENYFLHEMPNLSDRTSSSIRAMTASVIEPFLASPLLRNFFCGGTRLHLDDLFAGKIVLLQIPIQTHEFAGRIAQVLFKYMLQKRIEARDLNQHPNPVFLWLDEYHNYVTSYDQMFLSTCRSSQAGCVLLTQTVANLFATIGTASNAEARINSLLGLVGTKIFLANGCYTNNEWGARTIGMRMNRLNSFTVGAQPFSESASSSQHLRYQVEPQAFTQLDCGGVAANYRVEAIITASRTFSNGRNFLKTGFRQPFAPH